MNNEYDIIDNFSPQTGVVLKHRSVQPSMDKYQPIIIQY